MSASHAPVLDAVAFELMAALEQYERDVERLTASWLDMDRYTDVSNQIEKIRGHSAALPALSAQWVELLIAHAELVHCLWRSQSLAAPQRAAQVDASLLRHSACIHALHNRCRALLLQRPDGAQLP